MDTPTIPVTITPEAKARLDELGFHKEMEQMIAYAMQKVPKLVRITVVLNERYDMGGEPGVAVEAWTDREFDPADKTNWNATGWEVATFPPKVLEHLLLDVL